MPSLIEIAAAKRGLPTAADKRDQRRKRVTMAGVIVPGGSQTVLDCTIQDISDSGARIVFARDIALQGPLHLMNLHERMVHGAEIAWQQDRQVGLTFRKSFSLSQIADPALLFLKRLWMDRMAR
jgi:hypothetical protein